MLVGGRFGFVLVVCWCFGCCYLRVFGIGCVFVVIVCLLFVVALLGGFAGWMIDACYLCVGWLRFGYGSWLFGFG